MEWSDAGLILLVLVALWTFLPRHFRHALRLGLEPTIIIVADAMRRSTRAAWNVFTELLYRVLIGQPRVMVTSSGDEDEEDDISLPVFAAKLNSETAEIPRWVGEIHAESFTLGETTALARLVASGELGLTNAVKIGADAKSGEKYQKRSRDVKALAEQMRDRYPQRTPEQEQLRKELGIAPDRPRNGWQA